MDVLDEWELDDWELSERKLGEWELGERTFSEAAPRADSSDPPVDPVAACVTGS